MIEESSNYIRQRIGKGPIDVAMILGSGLGVLADSLNAPTIISYEEIPGFASSKVEGHKGNVVFGEVTGKKCLLLQGRVHYYEGHPMESVVFPVRVLDALGIKKLIVTCASGGVHKGLQPGDIMLIEDQINFSLDNPLIGFKGAKTPFVDASCVYSDRLKAVAKDTADALQIHLKSGVYFYMSGPNYETSAEIEMIRQLGGDMAGMSTFPESLEAYRLGMEVLGLSYISNMGTGISKEKLQHQEVIETIEKIKKPLAQLIFEIIKNI